MTTTAKFDPAAWLAWAERLGYEVFLWDSYGDGCLGMSTVEPVGGRGRSGEEDDLDLWYALRGSEGRTTSTRFGTTFGRVGAWGRRSGALRMPRGSRSQTWGGHRPSIARRSRGPGSPSD